MSASPRRRWFAFTLWSMFAAIGAACILSAAGYYVFHEAECTVHGDLSQEDVAAICREVATSPLYSPNAQSTHVIDILVESPTLVCVTTGSGASPRRGDIFWVQNQRRKRLIITWGDWKAP